MDQNDLLASAMQSQAPSNEVVASNINVVNGDIKNGLGNSISELLIPQQPEYPLVGVKREKIGVFEAYYGSRTPEFVYKCSGRGDQSWKNIATRIYELETGNDELLSYVARLYEEFDLDALYDPVQIITGVGMVRRELKLPIVEQTQKWYIQQVASVFLVEKVVDKSSSYAKVIGYKFLFRLKP